MKQASPSAAPAQPTRTDFADADVTFATDMYPHHAQAIEMARMVPGRSRNAQLTALATAIEKAQGPEMSRLADLLHAFGKPAPTAMTQHPMDGMMSPDQMNTLRGADGAAFDQQWLTMMIDHHQGAVQMAGTEITQGTNADLKAMAQQILATQQAEIQQMRDMLSQS
ncbi:MAG: DUF305 domain-containing protein [Nocardia sp.]|nr:DUF305 domain-containing protein [Nocardia sp.]